MMRLQKRVIDKKWQCRLSDWDFRIPFLDLMGRIAHALGKEIVIDFKTGHQN
jgi:hypothetical protein